MRTAPPLPAPARPAWRRCAALCLGALALGCASEIDRRFPELAAIGGHRLGDAHPYLLPAGDALYEFLCRWSQRRAVSVSLPPEATPEERLVLEAALAAWERAGLGLRQAARRWRLSATYLSDIERGKRNLTDKVRRLYEGLKGA